MLYIIIIFVFYLNKTVDCESYNKYSGYSGYSGYSRNIGYSNAFDSGYSVLFCFCVIFFSASLSDIFFLSFCLKL